MTTTSALHSAPAPEGSGAGRLHPITLVPGDWIGPETCRIAQEVLDAAGARIDWDEQVLTADSVDRVAASCRKNGVALCARVDATRAAGRMPPTIALRKALQTWSAVRPVRALPNTGARFPDLDIFVVRETSEDIYAGYEHEVTDGVYEAVKITTEAACERIARWAFHVAAKHGRRKVTIVHKSNIMKKSDGLFLRTAQRVAAEHPDIDTDEVIVDALCMKLVRWPASFDVLLMGNLFGDIVSDLVSGLAGGITAATTLSYGDGVALFSNPHGKAPDIVGENLANPLPMLQAGAYMMRHLGETDIHDRLQRAMASALRDGVRTPDLGGSDTSTDVRDAVIARL